MKQNIYDDPEFFNGYKTMRDNKGGLNEPLEQPAMISLLPDVKGMDVLDLGCGAGDLCRIIKQLGAKSVIGVDISSKMIELAKKDVPAGVEFIVSPIEDYDPKSRKFDLIFSSLALQYIENLENVYAQVNSYLKPNGIFLFSVEHPIISCAHGEPGWYKDEKGKKLHWRVDSYEEEGKRSMHWIVDNVVKYHKKFSTIINLLIKTGFTILEVQEPVASKEEEKKRPDLAEERRRPPFLIVKALKTVSGI